MPLKKSTPGKFKGIKNKRQGGNYGFQRLIKTHSFAELESLIKQARQAKNKPAVHKYKTLARQKLNAWAQAWQLGQQKLKARQQAQRAKKEARQAKVASRQQRKQRLGEIYHYFQRELTKLDRRQHPEYFTAQLSLDPVTKKGLQKLSRQHPSYDFYAEFRKNPKNLVYRLNKGGRDYLLKQTSKAYQEELADQASQIRYWQERAGLTKVRGDVLLKKGQKIKLFFPEKGEHKEFFSKKKEFKEIWQQLVAQPGAIEGRERVSELSQQLYQTSPLRMRDRHLIPTSQPGKSWGMGQIWKKYYENNPFPQTKKYYLRAVMGWLNSTRQQEGELVPDQEIELDRYGKPKLQVGQVISISSNKPGRRWSVYKNVSSKEEQERKKIHAVAHENYITNEGSELEIQTWKLKKNKALCWVEASLGQSCSANQGTSDWWCLFCIAYGEYHPPILPKHCPFLYTYKTWLCGNKEHSDANKQWHFSVEGTRIRDAIKGGDWGSCHIGTFDKKKLKKQKRK